MIVFDVDFRVHGVNQMEIILPILVNLETLLLQFPLLYIIPSSKNV